jgi:hypothetical protein
MGALPFGSQVVASAAAQSTNCALITSTVPMTATIGTNYYIVFGSGSGANDIARVDGRLLLDPRVDGWISYEKVTSFISKEAARCVAQATAPAPLLSAEVGFSLPWLGFNADSGRVEWSVTAAICCGDTWVFRVDAESGASALVSHTAPMTDCIASCAGVPITDGRRLSLA